MPTTQPARDYGVPAAQQAKEAGTAAPRAAATREPDAARRRRAPHRGVPHQQGCSRLLLAA